MSKVFEETEIERVGRNMTALGAAWRGDWSDFDGRQLRDQIAAILVLGGNDNTGVEFYHHHITVEFGHDRCPEYYRCVECAEADAQLEREIRNGLN